MFKKLLFSGFFALAICGLSFSSFAQNGRMEIQGSDTVYIDVQPDAEELAILKDFFSQTGGKKWTKNTNWLKGKTSTDFAKWYGVTVEHGDVVGINLDNNNLRGVIPKSLYRIKRLQSISFSGNPNISLPDNRNKVATPLLLNEAAATLTVPVTGKNLPMWGLITDGSLQNVDWRIQPTVAKNLSISSSFVKAPSSLGIDDCGRLAFYVAHSGVDVANQLHIFDADGVKLTNNTVGSELLALSSVQGNNEIQVVRVPGTSNQWFLIYSLFEAGNQSCNAGGSTVSSSYCAAKVVYTRITYDILTKTLSIPNDATRVNRLTESSVPNQTYIQGKAVSRTANGDNTKHFLYLAQRAIGANVTRIHRFIISQSGIAFENKSGKDISMSWTNGSIAGSAIELSPDETMLAINNRNIDVSQDIILFDLNQFPSPTYTPTTIEATNLVVFGSGGQTVNQIRLNNPTNYTCLQYLGNKIQSIQFSPSGRYLYTAHGGYKTSSSGVTYNTYLLQIDLQSATTVGGSDFTVSMQVQKGLGTTPSGCTGSAFSTADHTMGFLELAYDGRIYFTKNNQAKLFVIPNPDDPMPHNIDPVAEIDLSTPQAPNISMVINGATAITDSEVYFLPENIDGYDYLKESSTQTFTLDKESIPPGGSTLLTISTFNSSIQYQVNWGDGVLETLTSATKSHIYSTLGSYKIVLTSTGTDNCATVFSKIVTVEDQGCAQAAIISISNSTFICAVKFSSPKLTSCLATYNWDFGDGTTASLERNPIHAYSAAGTYTVSLTVNFNCAACSGTKTVTKSVAYTVPGTIIGDEIVQILSENKLEVISTSASSYSDAWPLSQPDVTLDNRSSFVNGTQGVWRNNASFVYKKDRQLSANTNIKKDGTFTLEHFNWDYAELNGVPNWIKATNITRYSPYSYELENKDVLDIYSGAVYDYGGQLPAANGANMRNDEMAFTSFEFIDKSVAGNWILGTTSLPAYTYYKINSANKNMAIVEASLMQLANVVAVDVSTGTTFASGRNAAIFTQRNEIVCMKAHPLNAAWSIIVLKKAPVETLWSGTLRITNIVTPIVAATTDVLLAHTGKYSLKVTTSLTFKQDLLKLNAGKKYWVNGWVSINNASASTPVPIANLGIDIIAKQKNGTVIQTFSFSPTVTDMVIEGWQQFRGTFLCPANTEYIEVKFKNGSSTAWYDDVRLQPEGGNMKGYVYNVSDYRLRAVLDEENFASYFYYDKEGNLYLTKKETKDGIKTLSENISYQIEH